jgi:hypothetical protein
VLTPVREEATVATKLVLGLAVYADWLEDHAQSERAEFIRLQCLLATLPEDDPQRQHLEAGPRGLFTEHETAWAGPLADFAEGWQFERGFVEAIEIHAATLLRQADDIFRAAPVREVRLHHAEGLTAALAACPHLGKVVALNLSSSSIGEVGLGELLSSPWLSRLRKLTLDNTGIGPAGLHDLLAHAHLMPDLAELRLAGNRLGDGVVEALAASPLSCRLEELDLSSCLGPGGVRALASSPSFGELRFLHLVGCQAGDAECEALACGTLARLTDLSLGGSPILGPSTITAAGIAALVHSPTFSRLRYLHLADSGIDDAGVEVLATSRELGDLGVLSLGENAIGARGVRALTRSRFWPNLLALFLDENPVGDAGRGDVGADDAGAGGPEAGALFGAPPAPGPDTLAWLARRREQAAEPPADDAGARRPAAGPLFGAPRPGPDTLAWMARRLFPAGEAARPDPPAVVVKMPRTEPPPVPASTPPPLRRCCRDWSCAGGGSTPPPCFPAGPTSACSPSPATTTARRPTPTRSPWSPSRATAWTTRTSPRGAAPRRRPTRRAVLRRPAYKADGRRG